MSDSQVVTGQHEFKAEVKQLLNILVHSLYTNKEIFLRELISNASDALDKLRFESTRGTEITDSDLNQEITLSFDKDKNVLTISDTGIGMTSEEIIKNIGTIAKSGSAEFIKQMTENQQDAGNIIGKFGVGFYSVFMVAKEVRLRTKSFIKDEPAMEWISDGLGSYTLEEIQDKKRGTEIEIHLKEEEKEFVEEYRLEQIVKKHSNFIAFPIKMNDKQLNTIKAVWREPKSSIKEEEYNEFYKFLSYDPAEPAGIIHKSVDAPIQFNCLLFIPQKNDELFGYNRDNYGLDLYIRRVLIQHKNKDLLPEYLGFVKGVVDSEDLPLNISRETLQEDLVFNKISKSVTGQVYTHLEKLAVDEEEKYNSFWNEHSRLFKMGYSDYTNRERYSKLLRFNSSACENGIELTSFDKYVHRIKEEQKEIYYKFGTSREAIETDPHLEIFKSKGIEVLYLLDPVDEFVMNSINTFGEYQLVSVDQADLSKLEKFDKVSESKEKVEELSEEESKEFDSLLGKIKEILGDKVTEVRVSKRLEESPACLINPDDSMSATMQKMMNMMNKDASIPKKIFEVNKDHLLFRNLLKVYKKDNNDDYINNVVEQLYESALLLEGYLTDPHKLVNRINSLLEKSSSWYTDLKK